MPTEPLLSAYVVAWSLATIAAVLAALGTPAIRSELGDYARFLVVPWKLAVFVPAAIFVTFAGRFAYDDTWDIVEEDGSSRGAAKAAA